MPASEIRLGRVIDATPATVWEVLTDIDHADETLSGVTRVERVGGHGYEVGTRWRETRRMMGKEATEEMWVSEIDPERRTVVEAHSAGTAYRTLFELADRDGKTHLAMTFTARVDDASPLVKAMSVLFGPLGRRVTRKAMTQDLEDIARRAEAR